MKRLSIKQMVIVIIAGLTFACVAPVTETPTEKREADLLDMKAELNLVSPYITAGRDARFLIEISSSSGFGMNPSMLDASCFRVRLESGEVLTPGGGELVSRLFDLGSNASISRAVDLKSVLKGLKTQDIEVWWEFGELKSEIVSARVYEWDLKEIEAVIQTTKGEMVLRFFPDKAPVTVKNFVDLSLKGFYDGLKFHRVVPGFMIQGGCPSGDGTGDPGYFIPGEFSDISHERGVISMARSEDPDSAGCQFFIMHQDNPGLDGLYAAFGKMVSGFEALDDLANVDTQHQRSSNEKSRPSERLGIDKIIIREKIIIRPEQTKTQGPKGSTEKTKGSENPSTHSQK